MLGWPLFVVFICVCVCVWLLCPVLPVQLKEKLFSGRSRHPPCSHYPPCSDLTSYRVLSVLVKSLKRTFAYWRSAHGEWWNYSLFPRSSKGAFFVLQILFFLNFYSVCSNKKTDDFFFYIAQATTISAKKKKKMLKWTTRFIFLLFIRDQTSTLPHNLVIIIIK